MATTISVGEGVKAGYGFILPSWRRAIAALVLYAVTANAYFYTVIAGLAPAAILATLVLTLLASCVVDGGLLRIALDHGKPGPGGLQWGRVESRLLGLALLCVVLFSTVSLLLLIVLVMVSIGVSLPAKTPASSDIAAWMASIGSIGAAVFCAAMAAAIGVLVWLSVRLCLAQPATVARDRIQLLSSITLTRHGFPILLGVVGAVTLPILAVLGLAAVLRPTDGAIAPTTALVLAATAGLALALIHAPAKAGALAYLYRRLSPPGAA